MAIQVDLEREFIPAVNKIMAKLKELEEKIDLIKSDLELIIGSSNKAFKEAKKVK